MAEERDPYSKVVDGLWNLLEAKTGFIEAFRPANRIKYTGTSRDPEKTEISDKDTPEIRIIVSRSAPNEQRTSCSTFDRVTFEIQVASGDQRIDHRHLPLKWLVFRAAARMLDAPNALTKLTWNGKTFVHMVEAVTVVEGQTERDLTRGILGWTAIWAVDIQMHFTTADL